MYWPTLKTEVPPVVNVGVDSLLLVANLYNTVKELIPVWVNAAVHPNAVDSLNVILEAYVDIYAINKSPDLCGGSAPVIVTAAAVFEPNCTVLNSLATYKVLQKVIMSVPTRSPLISSIISSSGSVLHLYAV